MLSTQIVRGYFNRDDVSLKFNGDYFQLQPAAGDTYDTKSYLDLWQKNAVLDDPLVGQVFKGHSGISAYFEDYFIGYKTQTELTSLNIINDNEAHIEVKFTGDDKQFDFNSLFFYSYFFKY